MCSDLFTVVSEIAMVPDNEFTKPILIVGPETSTQLEALDVSVALDSKAFFCATVRPHPQPLEAVTMMRAAASALNLRSPPLILPNRDVIIRPPFFV